MQLNKTNIMRNIKIYVISAIVIVSITGIVLAITLPLSAYESL